MVGKRSVKMVPNDLPEGEIGATSAAPKGQNQRHTVAMTVVRFRLGIVGCFKA